MKWKQRPGINELQHKLQQARKAIAEGKHFFGPSLDKLVDEFIALNIGSAKEIWPLLKELIEELSPEHYAGPHPPMKSTEAALNCELFIFVWDSKKLKKPMYLKFCIKDDYLYYVSLHKSQKPKKVWKFVDNFDGGRSLRKS
jgi:hypothetical protein